MFKIIRVRRVGIYISILTLPKDAKAFINMIKLAFYMLLWLHISACIWYFMTSRYYGFEFQNDPNIDPRQKVWYSPNYWYNYPEQPIFVEGVSEIYRYLLYHYYSVLYLFTNEIGPVNNTQIIFSVFFLLVS